MEKVLITEKFHSILYDSFSKKNWHIDEIIDIDTQGVREIIENYSILIVNSKIICDKNLLKRAKNLKIIGRVGAGMEIIDLEYCYNNNIKVVSAPEGNRNAVAEHVIAMILGLNNNIYNANNSILSHLWYREKYRGSELCGKTIGIIGFGNTGSYLAKRLQGFEVSILALDIENIPMEWQNVKQSTLEEIQEKATIVSLHLPLNSATINMVNMNWLQNFKNSIGLVNTSRGKIVNTQDLIKNINAGKVKWAGLDVYENEPFSITEEMTTLVSNGKLILTPHIAGWTEESYYLLAKTIVDKIFSILDPDKAKTS